MKLCTDIFGSVGKKGRLNLNFQKIAMKSKKIAPSGNRTYLTRMGSLNASTTPTVQYSVALLDIKYTCTSHFGDQV